MAYICGAFAVHCLCFVMAGGNSRMNALEVLALIRQARELMAQGLYPSGRPMRQGALKTHPEHSGLLDLLAVIHRQDRVPGDAERTLGALLAREPQPVEARIVRARFYAEGVPLPLRPEWSGSEALSGGGAAQAAA
jgi:hypothetical protein